MAYTFAVNKEKIETVKKCLDTTKESIKQDITGIFDSDIQSIIDNNFWSGTSFDTFHTGVGKFKPHLNNLPDVIEVFSEVLKGASTEADNCLNEINSAIGKMSD